LTAFILSSVSLTLHRLQNNVRMLPSHCRGTVTIHCSFSYGCSIVRSSGTFLATGDCHSVHEDALFTAAELSKNSSPTYRRRSRRKFSGSFFLKNPSTFGNCLVSQRVS